MLTDNGLVGTWELVRYEVTYSDGRESFFPYGEAAQGQIIYTADHNMSAIIMRGDRNKIADGNWLHSHQAEDNEKAVAFDGYMNYAGHYKLEGQQVIHRIEYAKDPNMIGIDMIRDVRIESDEMVLSFQRDFVTSKVTACNSLQWQRKCN